MTLRLPAFVPFAAAWKKLLWLLPFSWYCANAFAAVDTQGAPAPDRVTTVVDAGKRVALPTRRAPWVSAANDQGPVANDLPLTHLAVTLKRSPERQQAFEQLLREQQDPASANYHHWLSSTEIGARFGASQHDVDAITGWLQAQGLAVDSISNSRTRIRFSGTAAAVAAAFDTEMRYYQAAGEKRIANVSDAKIPAALADAIDTVSGLQTVKFRSALHTQSVHATAAPQPAASNCSGGVCRYNVFPADFNVIYDMNPVYQQGIDGTGQTIAVVGRARVYEPDVMHYQQLTGQAISYPVVIVPPDGTDPGTPLSTCSDSSSPSCGNPSDQLGDQAEATLDVQRAGSVAPGATIDLIVSANTNSVDGVNIAVDYAIDTDPVPAKLLSISFTSCEADNGSAVAGSLDDFFGQAAAEGISVFVASGDAGVAGCASLDAAPTPGEPESTNILCSSGSVTCVGGTQFTDTENPTAYWRSTNSQYYLSAIGYIPEGSWNEPLSSEGDPQLAASGGGVSAYIAKPSWQTGTGVPGSQGRYTPDVSLHASVHEGYFTCVAAQGGSCVVSSGSFTFISSGGTSASAPSMAGIAALLNQKEGSAQGNLNPRLYALAATPANGVFHDITVGTSGVSSCALTVPSACNNSTPGPSGLSGGLQGYAVGAGYDRATGLGSIDAANLVARWGASGATPVNLNQIGLTGSWYNPATSGQGVVMQVAPDLYGAGLGLLFGGWFTYDVSAAGGQRWYSIQGQVSDSASSATMPIYVSQGGNFNAPPVVGVEAVGQATLAYSDCTHGSLSYSFTDGSGRSGTIPLTRLGDNVMCTPSGDAASTAPDYLLSGTWYNAATSGQGFVFDVNPVQGNFFGAWYTYAPNGQQIGGSASQRWFSLQSSFSAGEHTLQNVGIFATTGGVFDDPTTATTTQVGTATVQFQSCSAATLTYTFTSGAFSGQHGTIALGRASAAPAGCNF